MEFQTTETQTRIISNLFRGIILHGTFNKTSKNGAKIARILCPCAAPEFGDEGLDQAFWCIKSFKPELWPRQNCKIGKEEICNNEKCALNSFTPIILSYTKGQAAGRYELDPISRGLTPLQPVNSAPLSKVQSTQLNPE